jgi:hypothetical protein
LTNAILQPPPPPIISLFVTALQDALEIVSATQCHFLHNLRSWDTELLWQMATISLFKEWEYSEQFTLPNTHILSKNIHIYQKYSYSRSTHISIINFSIFAQVNINPTRWLVKFDVISCYIKHTFSKWPPSRFVEVTNKEISEIKINSVQKTCVKILKQLFASGLVIIGEYSPRLRLGEYSPIITSPSTNNC